MHFFGDFIRENVLDNTIDALEVVFQGFV